MIARNLSIIVKSTAAMLVISSIVQSPLKRSTINETSQKPGLNKVKILLSLLAGAVLSCKGNREISKKARPIVIFEDIESRFHPSLSLSFWSLVEAIDFQKIITTNSGDLLSAMTLYSLRRLHRRCAMIRGALRSHRIPLIMKRSDALPSMCVSIAR